LWHTFREPGSWQSFFGNVKAAVTGDPGIVRTLACAADAGTSLHVVAVTADGVLWHTLRRPDGTWQTFFGNVKAAVAADPGKVVDVGAAADSSGTVHVLVVTTTGDLYHALRLSDGSWQQSFADVKADGAGDPGRLVGVDCARDPQGGLHVVATTAHGTLWHTRRRVDGSWAPFASAESEQSRSLRFWRFMYFRRAAPAQRIEKLLALLSKPADKLRQGEAELKANILAGYEESRDQPFQPHAVARTRPLAYQYSVVMRYLDNLIAWGDSLFMQDTVESINEATQHYVLAANLLGPRPQRLPERGAVAPKTFAQLKAASVDEIGNAMVELEGQFPFNVALPAAPEGNGSPEASPVFGIGRTLYFCIPRNDKLLAYWDTVADRLFKIRHCMNIQGVVRQLALFDPPLDPGMLVKAAAAGIDVGSVLSGLNQPAGPVRALPLIQQALALCAEVRGLGNALLNAMEKRDGERLARIRQGHEIAIQELSQDTRFLQLKQAEEATELLLRNRASALDRYRHYQQLLGLQPDPAVVPDALTPDRRGLTEDNFDEAFAALVAQYDKPIAPEPYPRLELAAGGSPATQSGASGAGDLHLSTTEEGELTHLRVARDTRLGASVAETIATVLTFIPDVGAKFAYWGIGGDAKLIGGAKMSDAIKIGAEIARTVSAWESDQAGMASRTASHERRVEDWTLQLNLAGRELSQIGRQVVSSLIAEQVARHEYDIVKTQIEHSKEIDRFLREDKQASEELYAWMQGELSRLYYEYYRFAVDTARRAEAAMKRELMRPEVSDTAYIRFNYWDRGRDGLLSADALDLDLKRMELAYHDNNRREYELARHVSLRQLDPLALLRLKTTGRCEVTIPEWLYDQGGAGHYTRRIKSVALSLPAVAGPYASVSCTLTLLRSSIRISPALADGAYARRPGDDDRFVDYLGSTESVVTSGGANDSGLFETNLHDERFLPFEGAGAVSTWRLELPAEFPAFDYSTIADAVLHIRYTARQGSAQLASRATEGLRGILEAANASGLALLFSLPHDFATAWATFSRGTKDLAITIRAGNFPYMVQDETLAIDALELYAPDGRKLARRSLPSPATMATDLNGEDAKADGEDARAELTIPADASVLRRTAKHVFLVVRYSISARA
jgi:hypothetical protein